MASERSQERTYSMEFAIPPPRTIRIGEDITPPLAVRVRIRDAISDLEISGEDELSYLFVAAALYDEGGGGAPIAPPDSGLISGRLSGSLELLNEYHEGYEDGRPPINDDSMPLQLQQGSFALFSSLRINRPGNYRIGITLLRVGGSRMPPGRRPRSEGGMSLAEVMSEPISVQSNVPIECPLGVEAREFLYHLRNRGYDIPSPS
ncbi:hypothetical protein BJ508DRAFT_320733 [Ascobolus immersus RN42]|uniref:Velvet domain-containing protein n=1 Tax=Ascobolus immersus RN42 TaxID=1160509 RepID=A0A3N4IU60_ASCIM|nr:hypothetical protein BJ508DRAFT_320733 [Ascobolus immersus RN42]